MIPCSPMQKLNAEIQKPASLEAGFFEYRALNCVALLILWRHYRMATLDTSV